MVVVSMLYVADVKSNSLTATGDGSSDYYQTLTYLSIDFVVELVVFVLTVLILECIFPNQLSAKRILCGLIRANTMAMFFTTLLTWIAFLSFQYFS